MLRLGCLLKQFQFAPSGRRPQPPASLFRINVTMGIGRRAASSHFLLSPHCAKGTGGQKEGSCRLCLRSPGDSSLRRDSTPRDHGCSGGPGEAPSSASPGSKEKLVLDGFLEEASRGSFSGAKSEAPRSSPQCVATQPCAMLPRTSLPATAWPLDGRQFKHLSLREPQGNALFQRLVQCDAASEMTSAADPEARPPL